DGMFAFGIWDAREGSLFLCRDRLGVKPLYFAARPRGIAFASEVRALLATGMAGRTLSPEGLRTYLEYGSVSDPYTILADVRSLGPGELIQWRRDGWSAKRYWRIPSGEDRALSFEEAVEGVKPRLRDAVGSGLVSDVPLGV